MSFSGGHGRVFRALLLLYPRSFRRAYGDEMSELFRRRLRRARRSGRLEVFRLWIRVLPDLVATAAAERAAGWKWSGHRGRPEGLGALIRRRRDEREAVTMTVLQDLRQAARRLVRAPIFSLFAVMIIAVGVGANAAVFAVVDDLLLAPPPYEDPDRVVRIYQDSDDGEPSSSSFPAYRDMASFTGVFSGVGAWSPGSYPLETDDGIRTVSVEFATSSYFPVLGLEPSRGRWFDPEHDRVGAGAFAVVSHRTWRTHLGGDPGVVGRTVRLNGHPVTVIGVGPPEFNGGRSPLVTDFWLSISSTAVGGQFRVANLERRQDHWYDVTARLAPGVTVEQAQAAMDELARRLAREHPELNQGREITVFAPGDVRIHPDTDAGLVPVASVLTAVVGLVLLLACSNLANLLLVRGVARVPEIAVRRALGAGRARVAGLFLGEAALLSLVGGGLGLLLARWALAALPALPLPLPGEMTLQVTLDHRVLLFTLGLVLATGVLFGLAPAVRAVGRDVASSLKDESVSSSPGRGRSFLRSALVGAQVAISLVLLVGAGLMVRSLAETARVETGVDADRVAYASAGFQSEDLTAPEVRALHRELERRAEALPGVERGALTTRLPVSGGGTTTTIVEGYSPRSGTGAVELPWAAVSEGYWEAMGIPLLAGRSFEPGEGPDDPPVVMVNEAGARRFWGEPEAAIGGRIRPQSDPEGWVRVVGVVADVKVQSLQEGPTPQIYYHLPQTGASSVVVVARALGDPGALVGPLREEAGAAGGSILVRSAGTLATRFGDALALPRTAAAFLGGFSILALILAGMGIYAVVAFSVARRTEEMGIRIALGAGKRGVIRLVVGEVLGTVMLGLGMGLGLALLAAPALQGILYGVPPLDPVTFGGVGLLLAVVAVVAAYVPARRAAGADPVEALRSR